jgi:hypothetical protein
MQKIVSGQHDRHRSHILKVRESDAGLTGTSAHLKSKVQIAKHMLNRTSYPE